MRRILPALAAAVVTISVPACGPMGRYNAEARDTWSKTYSLAKNGEVRVSNVNGRVDVEGTDGSTVEVQAERIARAATDQLAKDLLPKIPINERSAPDTVVIETGRISGILIGASYEVRYRLRVPKTASVRATNVNGGVDVRSLAGHTVARTTNGGVRADKISGSLEARSVNGGVRAQFDALGTGDITLGVVNGGVHISLPPTAKATVSATWVNGGFNTSGLQFATRDSGKRHFEGVLNGGGTSITATTVNGGIRINAAGEKDDGDDIGDQIEKTIKHDLHE